MGRSIRCPPLRCSEGIATGFIRARGPAYWRRRFLMNTVKRTLTAKTLILPIIDSANMHRQLSAILDSQQTLVRKGFGRDRLRVSCRTQPVRRGWSATRWRQAGREERVVSLFDVWLARSTHPTSSYAYSGWRKCWGIEVGKTLLARKRLSGLRRFSVNNRKIAWLSRRSTQEYAGFLEWLWRLGEEPIEVVDLTDVVVAGSKDAPTKQRLAISLGLLPPRTILENDLPDRPEILNPILRARYRELWGRLKVENAPLRILSEGELVSARFHFLIRVAVVVCDT